MTLASATGSSARSASREGVEDRGGRVGGGAHQSRGSTNTCMVPPQVSPTANASSSEYPKVTTPRSPVAGEDVERLGDHRALDAPARDGSGDLTLRR